MNVLSLFSGYGGIELGLKLAGKTCGFETRTICYVEREAFPVANLVKKMEQGFLDKAPIWSDVTTFPTEGLMGKVDIITGGFPCQPWSVAGARKGTDDERWLWDDIERLLCEIRPGIIFLENVPGLLLGGIDKVLGSLDSLGYDAKWTMFQTGLQHSFHKRERIFIFAYPHSNRRIQIANKTKICLSSSRGKPSRRISKMARKKDIQDISSFIEDSPETFYVGDGDGRPEWLDSVRALGNGVVPIVAAYAFITLARNAGILYDL